MPCPNANAPQPDLSPPTAGTHDRLLLEIRNLKKVRCSADHKFELRIPEFVVRPGEFVVLVGSNGCGKSTLLDLLALIMHPDSAPNSAQNSATTWWRHLSKWWLKRMRPALATNSVTTFHLNLPDVWGRVQTYDGMTLNESGRARLRARHFGYVLQSGGLLGFLSVAGNAMLPAHLSGCGHASKRLAHLAEELEMDNKLRSKPAQLSGGLRQRAAIIRALIHQPLIVLADEPTAAVDQLMAREVMAGFKRAALESGSAVVLVTHSPELVAGLADRCYCFEVTGSGASPGTVAVTKSKLVERPIESLPGFRPLADMGTALGGPVAAVNVPEVDPGLPEPTGTAVVADPPEAPNSGVPEVTDYEPLAGDAPPQQPVNTDAETPSMREDPVQGTGSPSEAGAWGDGPPPPNPSYASAAMRLPTPILMIRLALADLRHEWLMNCCLALALVAVIAPLLLLEGLKTGVVEGILGPMRGDPHYRELVSQPGKAVPAAVLAKVENHPKIATVVRRPSSSTSSVVIDGVAARDGVAGGMERETGGRSLDLATTEGADPLLLENGIRQAPVDNPAEGFTEVVLTPRAVDALGQGSVVEGDTLLARVTRVENRRVTGVPWRLKVVGIAKPRIGDRTLIFVPLSFSLDVEAYKGGQEVTCRKWTGGAAMPESPLCDGALLLFTAPPGTAADAPEPAFFRELVGLAAWGEPERVAAGKLGPLVALGTSGKVPDGMAVYLIRAKGDTGIGLQDWDELREFLRQRGCETASLDSSPPAPEGAGSAGAAKGGMTGRLLPWVAPRAMRLCYEMPQEAAEPQTPIDNGNGAARSGTGTLDLKVSGLSADVPSISALGLTPPPAWPLWGPWRGELAAGALAPPPDRRIILPQAFGSRMPAGCRLEVLGQTGKTLMTVPVEPVQAGGTDGQAVISAELAGILRRAEDVPIVFNADSGRIFRERAGYAGFRCYAHRLEDVVGLERELGPLVPVVTRAAEIGKVLDLERNLRTLFQVIAWVAGLGAAAALSFSLFGSVESKKVDFSVMRLVGCGRFTLVFFPIAQALVVAAGAYLVAWKVVFAGAAYWINTQVGPFFKFDSGLELCSLPDGLAWLGLALTVAVGCGVALGAGWRASLADPAAALRQE